MKGAAATFGVNRRKIEEYIYCTASVDLSITLQLKYFLLVAILLHAEFALHDFEISSKERH